VTLRYFGFCTIYGTRIMALKARTKAPSVRIQAAPALAMALFEQKGLTDLIDSRFELDPRIKLTPGNAVKAMVGQMLSSERRRALFGLNDFYVQTPTERLFGKGVDLKALGATAFSRNLDRLFEKDLGELTYECYSRLAGEYGLKSNMFNMDMTNFGVTSLSSYPDLIGAAVPERCGHAKDGHSERLVYSLLTVTDENGAVCYEKPYDGATADSEMDRHAIEFLSSKTDPNETTLVADCKVVTAPLINLMLEKGFGFVSKCPASFGKKIREDIVHSVQTGTMDPSAIRDGWEIYDTDAETEISKGVSRKLRYVAFRTTDDVTEGMEYLRVQGLKEAEARFGRFESRTFNCEEDARRAFSEAMYEHVDSAYSVTGTVGPVEIDMGYGHRGRPRKGELPRKKTEYRVAVTMEFDEERAKALTQDRGVRVLITNLPRANHDADNIRFGVTADTVLKAYLDQYRIEHAFRLMKDGMGIDRVYIHRPSRENAMMFVISMATMVSDIVTHVLKENGIDLTMQNVSGKVYAMGLVCEGDEEYLDGSPEHEELFMRMAESLKLDPDHLID